MKNWALPVCAVLLAVPPLLHAESSADFFKSAARSISRAAPRAHVRFVMVRALTSANEGIAGPIGVAAGEQLVLELIHFGTPSVIHAAREVDLPDAYVSGTYQPMGELVNVTITMTSAVGGRLLYSQRRLIPIEWVEAGSEAAEAKQEARRSVRTSRAVPSVARGCAAWQERAAALQRAVVAPKARYWANRAYEPAPAGGAAGLDPRRLMFDPDLRAEFNQSLRYWLAQRRVPALTPDETRAFLNADLKTEELLAECAPSHGSVAQR
jgi:hypothetical protein